MKPKHASSSRCLCGKGATYAICCQPFHDGALAPDAESLMRSRYSAFVLGLEPYLLATWAPHTRPATLALDSEPQPKWLGLEVKQAQNDGDAATVEFIARYKVGGKAHKLHEKSRFVRQNGAWLYVDGNFEGEMK